MRNFTIAAALLATLAGTATTQTAPQSVRLTVLTGSKVTVDGGSNLHSWSCTADSVDARIDADAAIARLGAAAPKAVDKAQIRIPVTGLKCGDGTMDKNLYKALKASANPSIAYQLTAVETVPGADADHFTLKATGTLTIAGAEKPITMAIATTRQPNGTLKATGAVPLLMTDFGIKPPTAILGTLRTKDQVTVRFELVMTTTTGASPAARDR
jgi:polyisoprenoid-binding protein YceI